MAAHSASSDTDSATSKSGVDANYGLDVTFKGLTYEVRNNIDRKQILKLLDGVTGYIRAGEMVSLMGPSGSGKTTLLDVLAGRKTVGKATGTVLFDGQRPTRAFLRRYTGYVEQFDTLIGNMTVREMLQYTVELKSPMAEPAASKAARVARALDQLSLETCADVLVGTPANRGISGGQLKRANIGLALVASPKVLFLDEPTTGLDSFTAGEVIDAVRQLTTSAGITVIATIHSPPQRVFSTFDRIMVLLGGRTVHFGPASAALGGGPNSGLGPLAAIAGGGVPLRETGLSDSEWLMDVVVEADRKGEGVQLADKYAASALAKAAEREVDELLEASTARNKLKSKASAKEPVCKQVASAASLSRWRSSGLDRQESTAAGKESDRHVTQVRRSTEVPAYYGLWTMIKHRLKVDYRDPAFMGPRIMDKIVVNLIICTLYLHAGDNMSMSNIPNIVACIFMFVILPAYSGSSYMPSIIMERPLYIRERSDGLYIPLVYFLFKMTEELLIATVISPIFAAMIFYGVRLHGSFALVWVAYLLTCCCGISLAYAVAALSPNMDVANAAFPAFVTCMLFYTGNLLVWNAIPKWLRWVVYLDFLHWPFGAITINQFQGTGATWVQGIPVLEYFHLNVIGGPWVYIAIELAFFFGFCTLAWAGLAFRRFDKR